MPQAACHFRRRFHVALAVAVLLAAAPMAWRRDRPLSAPERCLLGEWRFYTATAYEDDKSLRFYADGTLDWNSGDFDEATEFGDREHGDPYAFWRYKDGRLTLLFSPIRPVPWDWSSPFRTLRDHLFDPAPDVAVDGALEFISEDQFSLTPFLRETQAKFRRHRPQ